MSQETVHAQTAAPKVSQSGLDPTPPFISKPTSPGASVNYISVNPRIIVFDSVSVGNEGQIKELLIKNVAQQRIVFRVLSNTPSRYIVSPCSDFLVPGETKKIEIRLLDLTKYARKQKFIAQAKLATSDENNRKAVWKALVDPKLVHNIRVRTSIPGYTSTAASPSLRTASESGSSISSIQLGLVHFLTSVNRMHLGSSNDESAVTNPDEAAANLNESNQQIKELKAKISTVIAEKTKLANKMVQSINEVKQLEVELDRLTAQCVDLDGKIQSTTCSNIQMKAQGMMIGEEANAYRAAKKREEESK